jgi:hypothetical protein
VTVDGVSNEYSVEVAQIHGSWDVRVLEPSGVVAFTRSCVHEGEARTFASTVAQHIYWLSPAKFREYYRLPDPAQAT